MAEPNSGIARSGVVSIAGNSYTVVQPIACQLTLSANSQRFEATEEATNSPRSRRLGARFRLRRSAISGFM